MAYNVLKLVLYIAGVLVLCISGMIVMFGIDAAIQYFRGLADIMLGDTREITDFASPNVDSEIRFYSTILIGYGVLLIHTATTLRKNIHRVPWLALVFMCGGFARIVSLYTVGEPHGLFFVFIGIEIAVPVLVLMLYQSARRRR